MKVESRTQLRHLTPALSPVEAERVASPPCVTRFELAQLLKVSVRTVDRMIADGEIRVVRVHGKTVRIPKAEVERYLSGARTTDHGQQTNN